jgi:hypothetical protein
MQIVKVGGYSRLRSCPVLGLLIGGFEVSGSASRRQLVAAHMQRVLVTMSLSEFVENVRWNLLKI